MVCNTQDYWVFCSLSIVRYSKDWRTQHFGNWISLRPQVKGELNFVHRPVFLKLENTTFRKLDLFPSSDEGVVGLRPSSGILKTGKHHVSETVSVTVLR
jgi:hypothetical protein